MELEAKWKMQNGKKIQAKKKADCKKLGVFFSQMEGRDYEDLSSMNVAMAQAGEKLNEEMDNWCENRRGWLNDRVTDCLAEQKVRIESIGT